MASNVFGKPVTEGTRLERAATAEKNQNADSKRDEAIAYVRKQKEKSAAGVSTLCILYNATGETLHYDKEHSWFGRVWDSNPMELQNGQWGAFLHVKRVGEDTGSMAYVIYRVEANNNEGYCSGLIAWANPLDHTSHNTHAFCDIYDDGKNDDDDTIYKNVNESVRQKVVHKKGIRLTTTIESGTSALFEAHFNLD
nr:hypothetical protein [Tanacetum cinerariifolium]